MRGIIVTVGSQSANVEFSLREQQPEYVALLATDTPESLGEARRLMEAFRWRGDQCRLFTSPDHPEEAARLAENCLHAYAWLTGPCGVPPDEIGLDPTGGRKWMSAAAIMSGSLLGVDMPYVHVEYKLQTQPDGSKRSVPDPDTMRLVPLGGIYECLNLAQIQAAIARYNAADYHGAALVLATVHSGPLVMRHLLTTLRELAHLADRIDRFEVFREELGAEITRLAGELRVLAAERPYLAALADTAQAWERLREVYGEIVSPEPRAEMAAWLALAAQRREARGQYDGAVLLYYRIIELASQVWLWRRGIDTSNPDWEKLPAEVLEEYRRHYRGGGEIPLAKGYALLALLGEPQVEGLVQRRGSGRWEPVFLKALQARNHMVSAHGFQPVAAADVKEVRRQALLVAQRLTGLTLEEMAERYGIPALPEIGGCPGG